MTVAQRFDELRNILELSKSEADEATKKQQEVFQKVKERLQPDNSFISGSYGRRTAIRPLRDIDLFLVLPPPRPASPATALEQIRKAVQEKFTGDQAHLQNHSVKLVLSDSKIGFDVVPAFKDPDMADFYWLPERDSGQWIRTNPRKHEKIADERDQQTGATFKPLVKMLRLWRRRNGKPVGGFQLEVMASEALTAQPRSYAEGLAFLFNDLSQRIKKPVLDPAGTGLDVAAGTKDRDHARKMLEDAAKRAAQALELERAGKPGEAWSIWNNLLGADDPELKP